jgi:hypothetical protein
MYEYIQILPARSTFSVMVFTFRGFTAVDTCVTENQKAGTGEEKKD